MNGILKDDTEFWFWMFSSIVCLALGYILGISMCGVRP